jgi:hypothetical protein
LYDFLSQGLCDFWRGGVEGGEDGGGVWVGGLRVEDILETLGGCGVGSEGGGVVSEGEKGSGWSGPQTLETESLLWSLLEI